MPSFVSGLWLDREPIRRCFPSLSLWVQGCVCLWRGSFLPCSISPVFLVFLKSELTFFFFEVWSVRLNTAFLPHCHFPELFANPSPSPSPSPPQLPASCFPGCSRFPVSGNHSLTTTVAPWRGCIVRQLNTSFAPQLIPKEQRNSQEGLCLSLSRLAQGCKAMRCSYLQ